jgi:acyl-coenzyme A synthetase/AMP-(fatty) acid ligase
MNLIEYLEFRARFNTDQTAVVSGGRILSYADLLAVVRGAAAKLRRQGLTSGQTVAIYVTDPVHHWILTLAVMHEAAASASAHPNYDPMPTGMPVDVYIADRISPFMTRSPVVQVDAAWFNDCAAAGRGVTAHGFESEDALARVVSSSGTTGEPKAIGLTIGMLRQRVWTAVSNDLVGPSLTMMTLSTVGGFSVALNALVKGKPIVFAFTSAAVERSIELVGVSSVFASPVQLASLVSYLEPRSTKLPSLRNLAFAGATMPASLMRRLQRRLLCSLEGVYGSTETGMVTAASTRMLEKHSGCAGIVVTSARVELVDEQGVRVPDGQDGIIRIQTMGMATGYIGDPQTTAQAFRDGWFFPGDRGRFVDDGVLVITGRETELINMGGSKMNPVLIDEFLCEQAGIRDAAAFGVENDSGVPQIWAAVVVDREIDVGKLIESCRSQFGVKSPSRIFALDSIPRNTMGKTQRDQVKANVMAMIAQTRH